MGCSRESPIIIVPGVRFPVGASLPASFPYLYIGPVGKSWDCVGLLVLREMCNIVTVLDEVSTSDRRIWFQICDTSESSLTACGIYAPTGGDLLFYKDLVEEGIQFQHLLVIGDCNSHPTCVVDHPFFMWVLPLQTS